MSGTTDAISFTLARPKGSYDGPGELKKYTTELYKYAIRLEEELESPQDIEWAVAGGKLYLLQSRPITTLTPGGLGAYEINESLAGDANVGEAIPDVVTPLTWSLVRELDDETNLIPGYYLSSGNICGRIYSNLSLRLSAIKALYGWDAKRVMKMVIGDVFGRIPEEVTVPVYPFSRWPLVKAMLPRISRFLWMMLRTSRQLPAQLEQTPAWCSKMTEGVQSASTPAELLVLWQDELEPNTTRAWWGLIVGGSGAALAMRLSNKLTVLVGAADANTLMSNLRGESELASLGPVVGISKVVHGDMSREEYLRQYGHRSPHEFELSMPGPAEDAAWLDKQIEEFEATAPDVAGLLEKQRSQFDDAKRRFVERYPRKTRWLDKQLARAGKQARQREAARSEFTRVFRMNRMFALRTGEITGIGESVFFLYADEMVALLAGDAPAIDRIPTRRTNYEKYRALPPFPPVIRGRFDPFQWSKDPNRRMDYYDAFEPAAVAADGETLTGFAGAAGRVEGLVRVLAGPDEGDSLQPGEILVTTTTNVGWTPLFLRAAAIVTDVGAPLSHAAIVARELGIPAVVGCGNATTSLKTGDRIVVDGGQGIVRLLS